MVCQISLAGSVGANILLTKANTAQAKGSNKGSDYTCLALSNLLDSYAFALHMETKQQQGLKAT